MLLPTIARPLIIAAAHCPTLFRRPLAPFGCQVLRLTEVRVGEERPALLQRCEFAEKRCAEMESQRDR